MLKIRLCLLESKKYLVGYRRTIESITRISDSSVWIGSMRFKIIDGKGFGLHNLSIKQLTDCEKNSIEYEVLVKQLNTISREYDSGDRETTNENLRKAIELIK